ncbi:TonB family protein [Sphingomonas sinipercae]|uniref:TonB family protein n=1 Tax=Sphingomonas sinipercae TaxID=2714944 RepID=A0A6G7ZN30_9SPHN|nr:energy transducer TonB [Sphingomonas sinipercae]QIL02328.1 TonB family protein [Sphingomonas sinipercae]
MSYANRKELSGNRTAAIVVVALIHLLLGYAIVTGLAYNVIKKAAADLKTFDVEEPPPPPEEPPPPPEDMPDVPPPPMQPPPVVRVNTPPPPIRVQESTVIPEPRPLPPIATPPGPPTPPRPPAPPAKAQSAVSAKGDLRSLFSGDDFPAGVEDEGTTQATLSIGTDGRVSNCSITRSSGSRALDSATCRVLKSRARFTPARDSSGNPISDTITTPLIRWVLPE